MAERGVPNERHDYFLKYRLVYHQLCAYSSPMKRWTAAIITAFGLAISTTGLLSGCASNGQEESINTLFSIGQRADAAYQSYLAGVANGSFPTNSVPEIMQHYQTFRSIFAIITASSALSSNIPPAITLSNAQSQLLLAIEAQKVR